MWANGPFPCGSWPDLRIARNDIVYLIDEEEKILADGGYSDGNQFFEVPHKGERSEDQRMKARARARHETVNRRFKMWNILKSIFRHDIGKHGKVMMAIVNITHMLMAIEGRGTGLHVLHQVQYKDN